MLSKGGFWCALALWYFGGAAETFAANRHLEMHAEIIVLDTLTLQKSATLCQKEPERHQCEIIRERVVQKKKDSNNKLIGVKTYNYYILNNIIQ